MLTGTATLRPTKPRLALLAGIFYCWFLLASTSTGSADALKLTRLDVPVFVDPRSIEVTLRCEYDLEGVALYSVKWYRNDLEFFCYMPGVEPPGQAFDRPGVRVNLKRSDAKTVTLLGQEEGVNLAGTYACEVSTESPNFLTDYKDANMSVAVVPSRDPALEGVRSGYEIGELLETECTSAPSYPPASLTFILNDKEIPGAFTRNLTPQVTLPVDGNGGGQPLELSTTRLGLSLRLERTHFPGGSLSLICRATLPGISAARARKTEATSTLAANNQRLAQEPPAFSAAPCDRILRLSLLAGTVVLTGSFLVADGAPAALLTP